MGMYFYVKTQQQLMVEMLHKHGISIHTRLLRVSAQLGDAAVNKYVEDGVVCT